jgi:anti-sigma factor RsiW
MSTLNDEDRANLAAFLDGELDEETTQALEAKLNRDPEARQEVETLRQAYAMLDYLPRPEPSPNFTHRTMERLALAPSAVETGKVPARPSWRWWGALTWTIAVLLALGLGTLAGHILWPTEQPEDPLTSHQRVIENLRLYELIDDIDFLRNLDHPDLFAEEAGS